MPEKSIEDNNQTIRFKAKEIFLMLAIFSFFCIIFFFSLIIKKDFIGGDFLTAFGLFLNTVLDLKESFVSNWNPYIFSGIPLFVSFYYIYPPNWPVILLINGSLGQSFFIMEMIVVFHFFLGAIFTYMLARYLKINFWGSIISALIFSFSGYLVSKISFGGLLYAAIWLPLIFLFFHKGLNQGKIRDIIIAGFFMIMTALASHPQITYYIGIFLAFYTLFFIAVKYQKSKSNFKSFFWTHPLVKLGLIAAILVGGSAMVLLPLLNFVSTTWHGNLSTPYGISLSPVSFFVSKFFPENFGTGYIMNGFTAIWDVAEVSVYTGTLPLILSIIAAIFLFKKNSEVKFFSLATAFSLLIAFGTYSPLYKFLFDTLPIFNNFSNPGRFGLFFVFSISLLAGFGFDAITRQLTEKSREKIIVVIRLIFQLWFGISCVFLFIAIVYALNIIDDIFVFFNWFQYVPTDRFFLYYAFFLLILCLIYFSIDKWLAGKIGKNLFIGVLVLILMSDLFFLGPLPYSLNNPAKPEVFYQSNQVIEFLKNKDTPGYRIADQNLLNNGYNFYYKIPDIGGLGVANFRYEKYTKGNFYAWGGYPHIGAGNRLNLLNVRYVTFKEKNYKKISGADNLYENPDVLPRAFLVHNSETINDPDKILTRIDSEDFNPRETIILEKESPLKRLAAANNDSDLVKFTYYSPDRIDIYANSKAPSMLFLSEMYHLGWKAYVDGKPAEIYQANYLFRSVYLDKGPHSVTMIFDPEDAKLGKKITIATLSVLLLYFIYDILRNRKYEGLI